MRYALVFAAALLTGCATTSASTGVNPYASFNAWNGASAAKVSCQANPALCSRMQDAATRFTRSGPFMPY